MRANHRRKASALHLSWSSLSVQLFLVIILPLTVLLIGITFGSLSLHQRAMRTLVGERDELAVRTASGAIEEQINQRANLIELLAQQADDKTTAELEGILARAKNLSSEFDYGLAFWNTNGILEAVSGDALVWNDLESKITGLMPRKACSCSAPLTISSDYAHPQTGTPMVLILVGSPSGQRMAAGAFSTASMLQQLLDTTLLGSHQVSFLVVDSDRKILYQVGEGLTGEAAQEHPGVREALRGESGTTYIQAGGDEHVVAYSPVRNVNWGLVSEEPWEMVTSPTLRLTQMAPLALIPALLLALLGLWFVGRQVIQPLQKLEAQAARLSWGDFQAIEEPAGGIAEIQRLQAELAHMASKVQSAQRGLHDYIGAITAAQEDERRRLARELHDDTIQALVALKQRAQLAQMDLGDDPAAASLAELAALTEKSIENLRRMTRALRPIYLEDLGLTTALEMLARETEAGSSLKVTFQRKGAEQRLNPEVELSLYRMAQEALNNVLQHAQATSAELRLDFSEQEVALEVSDDGTGFEVPNSPAEFAPSGHFGLLGLHERAELIGARLSIESEAGKGTRLRVVIQREGQEAG